MESPGGVEWVMPGSCFHEQWTKKEFLFCNTGAPNPRPACCPLLPVVFHKTSSWCQKCWWLCCNRSSSDSVELHLKKKIKVCVWVGGRKGRKCSLCSGHEVLTSVCQYNGKQFNFGQMKGGGNHGVSETYAGLVTLPCLQSQARFLSCANLWIFSSRK